MDRKMLEAFGERDGDAVVVFNNARELKIRPQWEGLSVVEIEEVHLYEGNDLIAGVSGGFFWSKGKVDQHELGRYCAFAIDLEREVYRHYRQGKISEEAWQKRFRPFWKIVIKTRRVADALDQTLMPAQNPMDASFNRCGAKDWHP